MRFSIESGQSTIEAAFLLPVLFLLFGLFLQPGLLLYNRSVMNSAAAETCRLLSTSSSDEASIRAFVERRLASIPKLSVFHEGEKWDISWSCGETGSNASVTIVNHAKPLPLFGIAAGLTGSMASDGCIEQRVETSSTSIPAWASATGGNPASWIGIWK